MCTLRYDEPAADAVHGVLPHELGHLGIRAHRPLEPVLHLNEAPASSTIKQPKSRELSTMLYTLISPLLLLGWLTESNRIYSQLGDGPFEPAGLLLGPA